MAREVSASLEEQYRFPRLAHLHFKIKTRGLRSKWRQFLVRAWPSRTHGEPAVQPVVTPKLESTKPHFNSNRWAYSEGFWSPEFYRQLVEQWPGDRFFTPVAFITKSYDRGFLWGMNHAADPANLDAFPAYKAAYDYLRSPQFCDRMSALVGDGVQRKCHHVVLTRAYWGSSVIPHVDSSNVGHNLNLVIFINGSGGERAGGLAIWNDNEFKEKVFEPQNLKNTCIYYDMSENFYHGFAPMRFGTFRWTINVMYSSEDE